MNIPLALRVREVILEEPKQVYMGEWVCKGNSISNTMCETVGCIAGHTLCLARRKSLKQLMDGFNYDAMVVTNEASKELGLTYDQAYGLFMPWATPPFKEIMKGVDATSKPGTQAYAEGVVSLLDEAVKLYASDSEREEYFKDLVW